MLQNTDSGSKKKKKKDKKHKYLSIFFKKYCSVDYKDYLLTK